MLTVYKEIVDTLNWEKKEGRTMSPMEIIRTPTARKRLLIGMSPGPFSCIAGNIIASYYLGAELDTAGITSSNQQLKAVRAFSPPFSLSLSTRKLANNRLERRLKRMVPSLLFGRYTPRRNMGPEADRLAVPRSPDCVLVHNWWPVQEVRRRSRRRFKRPDIRRRRGHVPLPGLLFGVMDSAVVPLSA